MKAFIAYSLIGVIAFDEKGGTIDFILYPKNPEKIVEKLIEKSLTEEEKELLEKLKKKGYKEFFSSKKIPPYKFDAESFGERTLRENFRKIAKEQGFSDIELNRILTEVGIELTRKRIKEAIKKDKIVVQVMDAIDELDKSLNIFIARLREWYGLHFPEMVRLVEKHEKFAKLVSEYGLREKMKEKELLELKEKSMGIDLSEKDEVILKEYATKIKELFKLREDLEKYVDQILEEIAPNLKELAGPLLAGRLIALAGGLERLAKMPSSTIQLIGAEKSFFRFLRGRGKSPKHGILFQSQYIQRSPPSKRGKIARVLASKLSIAAKMDYYGEKIKSEELKKDLEERIKNIMEG